MLILTIKTEQSQAELALYKESKPLARYSWLADRQLAETIHTKIKQLLAKQKYELADLGGLVVYKGSGSFTGLRIGISVANALSDGLSIPLVGEDGEQWQADGVERLGRGGNDRLVMPEYGAEPHITQPKK